MHESFSFLHHFLINPCHCKRNWWTKFLQITRQLQRKLALGLKQTANMSLTQCIIINYCPMALIFFITKATIFILWHLKNRFRIWEKNRKWQRLIRVFFKFWLCILHSRFGRELRKEGEKRNPGLLKPGENMKHQRKPEGKKGMFMSFWNRWEHGSPGGPNLMNLS